MKSLILTGPCVKLFINNKLYKEVQQVSYSIDYGEYEIFGIDSSFPQEIAPGRSMVRGSITGIRIKYSGGIQAYDARPLIRNLIAAPYISIRLNDRASGEDVLFVQNAKITNQKVSIGAKGTVKLSFDFSGLIAYEPLDRA
jgi:hypothetical protein